MRFFIIFFVDNVYKQSNQEANLEFQFGIEIIFIHKANRKRQFVKRWMSAWGHLTHDLQCNMAQ